ncbi:MAG TPA: hypothetical protein VIK76_02305 [Pyrinomonadaceae bacterium]|jgi:hypothetical protein
MAKANEVNATNEQGEPVTVPVQDVARESGSTGAVSASGGAVRETIEPDRRNIENPLDEETIKVRVRQGMSFYNQLQLRKGGDEFDIPISLARAAAMYVDQVMPDGTLRSVPHEAQVTSVSPGQNFAGMATHERVEALSVQLASIDQQRSEVEKQLQIERKKLDEEIEKQKAAAKVPAESPAFTPGTSGAPGTTAVPPRPGEPGNTKAAKD